MINFKQCKELPNYSGIYGIKNVINQKFYIGSAESIIKRLKRHYTYLKSNNHHSSKLQRSWNKHGIENFEIVILESFPDGIDRKELLKIEEKYIKIKNSVENGYNMTDVCLNYVHFTQSEEALANFKKARGKAIVSINRHTGILEKEFDSLTDAANFYNITTSNISKVCKHSLNYLQDYVFMYLEEYDENKLYIVEHAAKGRVMSDKHKENLSKSSTRSKIIYKYDENYNLICTYRSRSNCESQEGFKKEGLRYKLDKFLENGFIYTHIEKLKI